VRVEEGSVGMGVAGTAVGEGPSVGGEPGVSAMTVLTTAVISTGVEMPPPLPGVTGAHAVTRAARIVKAIHLFISASFT
jgi:hypothetical protein